MSFKRILIPVFEFVPSGGNRVLCCLANEFIRMGIQVDFLVLDTESTPPFKTNARLVYAKSINHRCFKDSSGKKIGIVRNIKNLAKAIRRSVGSYDLVLASHSLVALSCFLAGSARQTLYYVQGYDPEIFVTKRSIGSWIGALLAYLSYWVCRKQVVNSPHYFGYSGISATDFVPPGVDVSIFTPRQSIPDLNSHPIRIGIIGRREAHKYRPVLEAARAIQTRHPNCVLVIAYGNIPNGALSDMGLHEVVVPSNDEELAAFYRGCDVFIALSEFPSGAFYPPLEALASGVFLISNKFLYVTEANSWVVDRPDQVAVAFDTMISSSPLERNARRLQGIKDVSTNLSWPDVAHEMLMVATRKIKLKPMLSDKDCYERKK